MHRIIVLSIFIHVLNGCTIWTHRLSPESSANSMEISKKEAITFSFKYIPQFGRYRDFEKEYKKFLMWTISILPEGSELIEIDSVNQRLKKHLSIVIRKPYQGGPGGEAYITGLTLGVIPSWRTFKNHYVFSYEFKSDNDVIKNKRLLETTMYNHLFLFPVFLIKDDDKEVYSHYKKSLTEFLY